MRLILLIAAAQQSRQLLLPRCVESTTLQSVTSGKPCGVSTPVFSRNASNVRSQQRQDTVGVYSSTQQFVRALARNDHPHKIRYGPENELQDVFWTTRQCIEGWKEFPHIIGIDNTFSTNKYGLYVTEITTMTAHKTMLNIAFGVLSDQTEDTYKWLLDAFNQVREESHVCSPSVVVTDMEMALKNALDNKLPDTQQQLCTWHVDCCVRKRITTNWHDQPDRLTSRAHNDATQKAWDQSRTGLYLAWQELLYARKLADHDRIWDRIRATYPLQKADTLDYLESFWYPLRKQWAHCFTLSYANFGQHTNSATEASHKTLLELARHLAAV